MNTGELLEGYDPEKITIGVLGSHSALDVCRGAKDEGFPTLVVCQKGREKTYSHYFSTQGRTGVVDETIVLDSFKDMLGEDVQGQLRERNTIFVPHRSFEAYLDFDYGRIEKKFKVPLFGSRTLLKAEERTTKNNQYDLLRKAGIRMPWIFASSGEIDRPCIVKLPERQRSFERAFFHCASPSQFRDIIEQKLKRNEITEEAVKAAVIEEFIVGPLVNFNYFYSPLDRRLELLGTDTRRQTNVDGILRLPAEQQAALHLHPKFEEAGHIAVTVLESMLEKVFDIGERFVEITQREYPPGIIGPFALQSAILPGPPEKDIVVFDVSLRVPGSPGIRFTPYSSYLYGKSLSAGRRIAMEIRKAIGEKRLSEVVT